MATDLAEFLGGAIGLSLLFQMTLIAGMAVTPIVTYGILMFEGFGLSSTQPIAMASLGAPSCTRHCFRVRTCRKSEL